MLIENFSECKSFMIVLNERRGKFLELFSLTILCPLHFAHHVDAIKAASALLRCRGEERVTYFLTA